MKYRISISLLFTILFLIPAQAEKVHLKNGDRISGEIISRNEEFLTLRAEGIGEVVIARERIARVGRPDSPSPAVSAGPEWERIVSAGYTQSSGNTETSQLTARLRFHRKTAGDEFHLTGDVFYASADDEMNARIWNGMTRYAYSFGLQFHWYHFFRLEVNHDRFADIDYRITPSSGVGHWFYDTNDFKLMAECALGYEHTRYRSGGSSQEGLLVPRLYFESLLWEQSRLIQDFALYPSLTDGGTYRIRSETSLLNKVDDRITLRFSLINEYNSDPASEVAHHDQRLISALEYSF
ncbi:MAG: DUF481 domain-containing protein [Candidatus Omnitrophica bacterium]|nr:DUF481 domain-containing protein [Candidatus Omnitrophota bacterium]